MASYGRTSTVRSHRRGGARRRIVLAPVLIIGSVIALVGAGVIAGYAYFVKGGCSGRAEATILVTPRIESIVAGLADEWETTSPSVTGTCAFVTVTAKDSADVAQALSATWDVDTDGPQPDVWIPDASAWARLASANYDAERIMPDLQPSLARTPTVIAMPKDMAAAARMSAEDLTWQEIIQKLGSAKGWKAYDHDEWGSFKLGLSDPQLSTAGLLALMAISDTDDSGDVTDEEKAALLDLKKVVSVTTNGTEDFFDGLTDAATKDADKALSYVSAFPALEQDVLTYNRANPEVPLVAVYPSNGLAEADFPYLVLNAEWADAQRQKAAQAFLSYARGPEGKAAFVDAGYRDGNRQPGPELTTANGLASKITALPRAVLLPESVQAATATWTALTRATNVLLVFDTSGSTGAVVPGTGKTRLDLTKEAALGAVDLLDDAARVGVWSFSTVGGGKDYKKVLGLARLDRAAGGGTHRNSVRGAINGLKSGGNTALYNTAWAACQEVAAHYQKDASNLVLLLTDGADDNNVSDSLSLDELVSRLKKTCGDKGKPVQLITIGLGISSDSSVLRKISAATAARTYSSPKEFDVSQVVLSALFG